MGITGLVVLGGHTQVPNPKANFDNAFQGAATPYGLTNALYRIIFSYGGYNNAFNVINEIKVHHTTDLRIGKSNTLLTRSPGPCQADQEKRNYFNSSCNDFVRFCECRIRCCW